MAFQKGSTIDPRLMKMDYSGFTNAANIRANAMSQLGQQVAGFIDKFDADQQKKKDSADFQSAILPELMEMAKGDEEKAKSYAKMLANNPEAFNAVMKYKALEMEQKKEESSQKAAQEAYSLYDSKQISAAELASVVGTKDAQGYVNLTAGQDAKKFDEAVTLAADSVGGTYDPKQNAIVVDENGWLPGGKTAIAISDPRFANYFATATGRNMPGGGYLVEGTNNSTSNPVVLSTPPSAPVVMESPSRPGIGSALMEIAKTPGRLDPTDVDISTEIPTQYIEPSLDISEVAGGAVSRMSDFFKRKLQENESIRQATYGR